MHFLVCSFTEPSPALRDWRPDETFRYPLLFALKYLLAKTYTLANLSSATLAEVVGAYASSGFAGNESEAQFAEIVRLRADYAAIVEGRQIRQERESLRVIAQLSYLYYRGQTLSVSLTPDDAKRLFALLAPIDGSRSATPDAEINRLAQLFAEEEVRPATDFIAGD